MANSPTTGGGKEVRCSDAIHSGWDGGRMLCEDLSGTSGNEWEEKTEEDRRSS